MSAATLRESAAMIRKDQDVEEQAGHINAREYNTWLAVADLLDATARMAEGWCCVECLNDPGNDNEWWIEALAVARAYLGEQS